MEIKKFFLVSVSMMLLALTSCTITGPEVEKWERMSFVSEETTIDESGNILVPASGGTYHIRCTNYKLIDLDYNSLRENDKERLTSDRKNPIKELKGEWTEVTMQDNVLTVSLKPNKGGEKRKSEIYTYSAGAIGSIIFNQAAE